MIMGKRTKHSQHFLHTTIGVTSNPILSPATAAKRLSHSHSRDSVTSTTIQSFPCVTYCSRSSLECSLYRLIQPLRTRRISPGFAVMFFSYMMVLPTSSVMLYDDMGSYEMPFSSA